MIQDLTDDRSILVQVIVWCPQVASHYLNQCRPNSMMPWHSLQWRHNGRDGVSNYVLSRLFRRRSKKIWKLCITDLCDGNSPITSEFPAQRASNAEHVSIWRCHHVHGNNESKLSATRTITSHTTWVCKIHKKCIIFRTIHNQLKISPT